MQEMGERTLSEEDTVEEFDTSVKEKQNIKLKKKKIPDTKRPGNLGYHEKI